MARTFLEAFACVRDIRLCRVFSPNAAHREAFADEMSRLLKIKIEEILGAHLASERPNQTI